MGRDSCHDPAQAYPMILCAEYGLHFAKDGDRWRCAEWPDLLMIRGERYGVTERTFGLLSEARRHMESRGSIRHP